MGGTEGDTNMNGSAQSGQQRTDVPENANACKKALRARAVRRVLRWCEDCASTTWSVVPIL